MVPAVGATGAPMKALITTFADGIEVHPDAMVTVKLYVPEIRFVIVVNVPVPVLDPGLIVQIPVSGRPFSTTLPVAEVHEDGWVIAPILGVAGVPGGEIIITSVVGREIHPASLVMLKL
jgi:hypothetical protein